MARDQGHPAGIRARTLPVVDGMPRRPGEVERAGDASATTPSILVPDGTDPSIPAARLSRPPASIEAQS